MRSRTKLVALLLAVMMAFSAVIAAGCSLDKEWAYKSGKNEQAVGVYIYELYVAYNQAEGFAKDQLGDDYSSASSDWLNKEITDDDGNKAVAREWIKQQAEKACIEIFALQAAIDDVGATIDEASREAADAQSKEYWNVGPYASYGYVNPMKDVLEPYGVSYESYRYCSSEYSLLYSTLFAALYEEGGTQAVKNSELVDYVNENYTSYSYFKADLFESTTDEAGESKNVALSDAKIKEIEAHFDGYVKGIDGGKTFEEITDEYMKANNITESPATTNTEKTENISAGEEIKAAVEKLENKKAAVVKVGEGENAIIYLVYKNDIKSVSEEYVSQNRSTLLSEYKTEDFEKYVEEYAKKVDYEKNPAIDGYDPVMFFVKVEPTTTAETTKGDE